MGIINAGTAVGSVLAPPLIGLILWRGNWREVFFVSGGLGLLWAVWWLAAFRGDGPGPVSRAAEASIPWSGLLRSRRVVGLASAKFLSDSAWYFYLFWLPKYLYDARGFDVRHVSTFGWIPYAASGVGSFLGGWYSSHLMRTGHSLNFSRKLALGLSAALMPAVMLVPRVPVSFALVLFSVVFFGQQSWSGLIMTVPADVFSAALGGIGGGTDRVWRRGGRGDVRSGRGRIAETRRRVQHFVLYCGEPSSAGVRHYSAHVGNSARACH